MPPSSNYLSASFCTRGKYELPGLLFANTFLRVTLWRRVDVKKQQPSAALLGIASWWVQNLQSRTSQSFTEVGRSWELLWMRWDRADELTPTKWSGQPLPSFSPQPHPPSLVLLVTSFIPPLLLPWLSWSLSLSQTKVTYVWDHLCMSWRLFPLQWTNPTWQQPEEVKIQQCYFSSISTPLNTSCFRMLAHWLQWALPSKYDFCYQQWIIESFGLEKSSKIIKSNL